MKIIKKHIFYGLIIGAYITALHFLSIGCPFRYLFSIPCPACGTTRALIELAQLHFRASLYYNPAAILILAAFIIAVHSRMFYKYYSKKSVNWVIAVLLIIILAVYIIRMLFFLIP